MVTSTIQPQQLYDTLERLSKSKTFQGAERNIRILRFLVKCYLNQVHVKEAVLQTEVFQKAEKEEPHDAKVRVCMFNLRKKLEKYYRTEGINDELIFRIKKGQYNLSVHHKEAPHQEKEFSKKYLYPIPIILVFFILYYIPYRETRKTFCWSAFFKKNAQSVCYVGDHYLINTKLPSGKNATLYVDHLHSDDDLNTFLTNEKVEEKSDTKAPFTLITKMGPVCAGLLTDWFTQHHKKLPIELESEMDLSERRDNNIVFIGSYRTLNNLAGLFLKESSVFAYQNRQLVDQETGLVIADTPPENAKLTHVMVSFNQRNKQKKEMIIFAANKDIGVITAVRKFTNQDWLERFYQNIPTKKSHFNALFALKIAASGDHQLELIKIELLD